MKKYRLIAAAGLFLLGACSRGTGSMELRNETDSVAYVIGLNVGYNLQRMIRPSTSKPCARPCGTYMPGRPG